MTSDAAAEPGPANPVLSLLRERRSVRAFSGQHVAQEDLRQILLATRQAPGSINAQGLSLVVVRDPERIRAVAQIAGGQPQVAGADVVVVFVIDFHRTGLAAERHGREQVVQRSAEGILVGAVDAGIALATFQTAAHCLGYATTAIGGIRNNPAGLIELLGLPEHTFPVVASTLGVAGPESSVQIKPRMPLESYAMEERYDEEAVAPGAPGPTTRRCGPGGTSRAWRRWAPGPRTPPRPTPPTTSPRWRPPWRHRGSASSTAPRPAPDSPSEPGCRRDDRAPRPGGAVGVEHSSASAWSGTGRRASETPSR